MTKRKFIGAGRKPAGCPQKQHFMKGPKVVQVACKPARCPHCRGRVVDILYGEPSYAAFLASQRGAYVLGGCLINETSPHWECLSCHRQFRRVVQRGHKS